MCVLGGGDKVVLRGEQAHDDFIIRLLDGVTGEITADWQPFCQHYCHLAALGSDNHFAELCPDCGSIRVYDVRNQKRVAFWSAHQPTAMCNGVDHNTLYVMDKAGKCRVIMLIQGGVSYFLVYLLGSKYECLPLTICYA